MLYAKHPAETKAPTASIPMEACRVLSDLSKEGRALPSSAQSLGNEVLLEGQSNRLVLGPTVDSSPVTCMYSSGSWYDRLNALFICDRTEDRMASVCQRRDSWISGRFSSSRRQSILSDDLDIWPRGVANTAEGRICYVYEVSWRLDMVDAYLRH